MSTGGDIIEITYNHEVLGSGTIFCKSNEDGTLEPGGYRSNDDDSGVTGNGRMLDQLNFRRASFESPPIEWNITDANELERLAAMAASSVLADWTIAHISGGIWGGKGKPVGDIAGSTNTALITLKLGFTGILKRIS